MSAQEARTEEKRGGGILPPPKNKKSPHERKNRLYGDMSIAEGVIWVLVNVLILIWVFVK